MIDINLLIKPPPGVRWWLVARTVAIVAAVMTSGFVTLLGLLQVRDLNAQIAEQQALAESYEALAHRLSHVEARLQAVQAAGAELAHISRNQRSSQAAILALVRPQAGEVWLTDVLFEAGESRTVTLVVRSRTFAAAMGYLTSLRGEPQFRTVAEVELTTDSTGDTFFTYLVRLREEDGP